MNVLSMDISSLRFRLNPPPIIEKRMLETLDICRDIYNYLILETRLTYREGYKITHNELAHILTYMTAGKNIYSKCAQPVVDQFFRNISVLKGLKKAGKKVGKLRFKSRQNFRSFCYNQSGFKIENNHLHLSKIGEIPIVLYRKIGGIIKEVRVKKEASGKWFAYLICQVKKIVKPIDVMKPLRTVGIDVGIVNFLYDSDGRVVEHPTFLKKSGKKLSRAQRKLSRRVKGSKNRRKQQTKVAIIHEKIANQRKDFLHKESHYYANNYDITFVEDLKVSNMVKCRGFAKAINDSSWSTFFRNIGYKVERTGTLFKKMTAYGTSQRCSGCGETVKKTLAIRTHRCPSCGLKIDRDYNASINIHKKGLGLLQELQEVTPCGDSSLYDTRKRVSQVWSLKQEKLLLSVGGHRVLTDGSSLPKN
jgi:putative transposase